MSPTTPDPRSQRVQGLSASVTLAITAKAKEMRAAGEDVIGFGAGEPDFASPPHVVEAAQRACAEPTNHRYTPPPGLPALREAIAERTKVVSGLDCSAGDVVVTNGAKHALYAAFQALIDPGDEVLLPAPYWVSYPEQVALAGGRAVPLPTTALSGWRVTLEELEAAVTPRTKALCFTSPSNPTGAVYPPEQIAAIGRWAAERGLWVVTDEIYEQLVYEPARHASMPVIAPEIAERCVVVNSVAKAYAMTGWRVGWTIAPAELTQAMAKMQSHATSNVANVSQHAAIAALTGPQDIVEEMRTTYERRRHLAHERLSAIPGVSCPMPEGAFYTFPSVEGALGRSYGGREITSSLELCDYLLEEARVALVPGEGFGSPGSMRVSYALADAEIERGLARIADALS